MNIVVLHTLHEYDSEWCIINKQSGDGFGIIRIWRGIKLRE